MAVNSNSAMQATQVYTAASAFFDALWEVSYIYRLSVIVHKADGHNRQAFDTALSTSALIIPPSWRL